MKPPAEFPDTLRDYASVCEDLLDLTTREHQALAQPATYQGSRFNLARKDLLSRLDQTLNQLRRDRQPPRSGGAAAPERRPETTMTLQAVQNLVVKILQLDQENRQALLKRGLFAPGELPTLGSQRPNYVAGLYRRHAPPGA